MFSGERYYFINFSDPCTLLSFHWNILYVHCKYPLLYHTILHTILQIRIASNPKLFVGAGFVTTWQFGIELVKSIAFPHQDSLKRNSVKNLTVYVWNRAFCSFVGKFAKVKFQNRFSITGSATLITIQKQK